MKILHELKLEYNFCDSVLCGDKCFEIRLNDRYYQKGDYVHFIPFKNGHEVSHPVSKIEFVITYVLSYVGIEKGFVVFGIRKVNDNEKGD